MLLRADLFQVLSGFTEGLFCARQCSRSMRFFSNCKTEVPTLLLVLQCRFWSSGSLKKWSGIVYVVFRESLTLGEDGLPLGKATKLVCKEREFKTFPDGFFFRRLHLV